jgi:hypothetical protein
MNKRQKFLDRILSGASDADIDFDELCSLLIRMQFDERIRGDHHIFTRSGTVEILNLQPKGGQAKPYQVKQVRAVILKYNLMEGV